MSERNIDVGLVRKWIAALYSGEYEQTQGGLCRLLPGPDRKHAYCCLGVMHEVSGRGWQEKDGEVVLCHRGTDRQQVWLRPASPLSNPPSYMMPEDEWMHAIGLSNSAELSGILDRGDNYVELWRLNDKDGLTFGQIADLLTYFYHEVLKETVTQ